MTTEGPLLESLTRRLAETPSDFLNVADVNVAAVISDLILELGGSALTRAEAKMFQAERDRRAQRVRLLACWLFHDDWFVLQKTFAPAVLEFLRNGVSELTQTAPEKFLSDPDRREEFARVCLNALGLRPHGETETQAQDRLTTLNSAERMRVIQAARAAEERARAVREALAKKAAEEAAAKAFRE